MIQEKFFLIKKFSKKAVIRKKERPNIYNLVYTRRAFKDIRILSHNMKKRIKLSLEKLQENPFVLSTKLVDESLGQYRYRIGDYRVIFDIHGQDIVILRVGHRREIYRK
ncbi:MAG: type II toxin-antitoxin system RelE/ParE family toxin [bacterium]